MAVRVLLAFALAAGAVPCCRASDLPSSPGPIRAAVQDGCAASTADGHALDCEDSSQLQVRAESTRGEARVHLLNEATKKSFTVDSNWKGSSKCENDRCDWFKLQYSALASNGVVKWTTIRTDWHPQSLLDRRDLYFQGGAWDGGKFWNRNRWWGVVWGNTTWNKDRKGWSPSDRQLAFYTYDSRHHYNLEFLAMRNDGSVYLHSYPRSADALHLPRNAVWHVTVAGSAWSVKETLWATLGAPLVVAAGVVTGGAAWAGIGALAGSTAAATSGTLYVAGAVVTSASALTGGALGLIKEVERQLFVAG